jgi:asparagine synthase (glutamine-hydrolysing)
MCGIVGIYHYGRSEGVDPARLKAMNDRIVHRGPDDEGAWVDGKIGLGMRRLSIIDLSGGHQPMTNEDGSLWIVFNGEIYNFQSLREELIAKGHPFKTHSDTEAILHLYEEHGVDCVKRLRGMFAFSLWDKKRKRLLLARDRIGKKPLVYALGDGRLAWASELEALTSLPDLPREIDPAAVDLFLGLQYIPSPLTIYQSVRKLPPAHRLVFENGQARVERYWDLPYDEPPLPMDLEEAKQAIRDKIKESTKLRMISDVPLGAFLSGGVDSSVVVAMMAGLSDRPVKTFSIGFEEEAFSELPFAREVAQRYSTDHTEFVVKPEMADVLPLLARHYGEPYADQSALPTYYVSKETRKHVTVALNGDGGDENFAGYLRYAAMKGSRYLDLIPAPAKRLGLRLAEQLPEGHAPYDYGWRIKRLMRSVVLGDPPARYFKMIGYFSDEEKAAMYAPSFKALLNGDSRRTLSYFDSLFRKGEELDFVNRLLLVDFSSYLPDCLMVKVDIASMANSLEGRSPLLDHELVEMVFRMPGAWKLKGVRGMKWIFKEAMKPYLPPSIYRRGKMGFGIPLGPWFRGRLKEYWRDHVLGADALSRGYFEKAVLQRYFDEHQSGKRDHGYRMWALLMLELWHQQCAPGSRVA